MEFIFTRLLSAKELRSYYNWELKSIFPDTEQMFAEAIKNNKNIKVFELFQDTSASRERQRVSPTNILPPDKYVHKFLPRGIKLSAADILIYDGNVAIINIGNPFTGVILKNADYHNSSKELFDLIWKVLPETKIS